MYYFLKVVNFLDGNAVAVLSAVFASLLLFGVVNWGYDPYRKQNKKFRVCTQSMRAHPAKTALYVTYLTEDYRRQWRAFVNCKTDKPSLVFEFVPKRKRPLALWLLVSAATVCSSYIAVFVAVNRNLLYVAAQVVFWLAFALVLFADGAVCRRQTRRAKRNFARFVAQLTAVTPQNPSTVVEDTVSALNKLNRGEVTDATVGKAGEILRAKGLSENRTVEQQRRINLALNGLLQAYARNSQRNTLG